MQTLSFLKEGLCRVADDPRDVALAQKPIALPSPQQQAKRRGVATAEASGSSQLIFPCSTPASAAALLSGSSGVEGGVMELPDGTRLEAEQLATKARYYRTSTDITCLRHTTLNLKYPFGSRHCPAHFLLLGTISYGSL